MRNDFEFLSFRDETLQAGTTTTRLTPCGRRRRDRDLEDDLAVSSLPFQALELIATGGMSRVYRGYDARAQRPVAIKILRAALEGEARAISTFATEYEVARRVSHEGIVSIREYGRVRGLPYLVMDWIDGAPLTALSARGPMAEARAAAIGAQVARALAAAHDLGVIHCDVKPDNIMVSCHGGRDALRAQLIDFGVARVAGHPRTAGCRVAGTPRYMAPEQWRGAPMAATDVYALGCVLYELVTGRARGVRSRMPPLAEGSLSSVFEALLLTMLDRGPDGRPSSLVEVACVLEALARRRRERR